MRRWLPILLTALVGGFGLASSLVVYPFDSQDTLLGVAVADRMAEAFADGGTTVVPPEAAPGLVPPLLAEGGFINLATLVGPQALVGPTGAQLVRGATGADVAVTGRVAALDDRLTLTLWISAGDGLRRLTLQSDKQQPGRLAALGAAAVASALGRSTPSVDEAIDLSGTYGDYVRALTLLGAGLPQDAAALLARAAEGAPLSPRAETLRSDLTSLLEDGEGGHDPVRAAVLSLSLPRIDEARSAALFQEMARATGLPVAQVWIGALDANVNDKEGAAAAFDAAAAAYPFGRSARAAFRRQRGLDGVDADLQAVLAGYPDGGSGAAALLGVSVVANQAGDTATEARALTLLGHAAPFLAYSFERRSFLAFDAERPLEAAEALAVAVDLEPDNSLYWTNLGWSYYLLGFLDRSERASRKALELDASQYIAQYNLGLVEVVTGRLDAALADYAAALRFDPSVDDEAIHDLERARARYPEQPGVHFALARLYEADGRRTDARDAYRAYLYATGPDAPLRAVATERVATLSAPPPAIEILGEVGLHLGRRGPDAAPYHPGDPLTPSFELSTPGDALPRSVDVRYVLVGADGAERASAQQTVDVPQDAVGFVVDDATLPLPDTLPGGDYRLELHAEAPDGRAVDAEASVTVAGERQRLRVLLGRHLTMTGLDSGVALYGQADLQRPEALLGTLVDELRASMDVAEQALPAITGGRFDGLGGAELFRSSSTQDVADFLDYLLASGARDTTFSFVDGYAQWAIDGAPAQPPAGNAP